MAVDFLHFVMPSSAGGRNAFRVELLWRMEGWTLIAESLDCQRHFSGPHVNASWKGVFEI